MRERPIKGKIVIVALDINETDDGHGVYAYKAAIEKIKLIGERIEALCEQLQVKEPNAMWIIGWREYGITETPERRAIPTAVKSLLKKTLLALTHRYPHLAILAGTVLTYKQTDSFTALNKLTKYYHENNTVRFIKGPHGEAPDKEKLLEYEQQIEALAHKRNRHPIVTIRNTCYFFRDKAESHDKNFPYNETKHNTHLADPIFQRPNSRNSSPLFHLKHPITGEDVMLVVEICNEHNYCVAHKMKLPVMPTLHFVISDSVKLLSPHSEGQAGIVQFDSIYPTQHYLTKNVRPKGILLYKNNLLGEETTLVGPEEPVYSFESRFLDELNTAIVAFSEQPKKHSILIALKKSFMEDAMLPSDLDNTYEQIRTLLTNIQKFIVCSSEENSRPSPLLYADVTAVVAKLQHLTNEQEKLHPERDLAFRK